MSDRLSGTSTQYIKKANRFLLLLAFIILVLAMAGYAFITG